MFWDFNSFVKIKKKTIMVKTALGMGRSKPFLTWLSVSFFHLLAVLVKNRINTKRKNTKGLGDGEIR